MINNIFLHPSNNESFDTEKFRRWLDVRDDTLIDPNGSEIYMVCGLPETVEFMRRRRVEDPSRFPYQVLIYVKPNEINIDQEYGDDAQLRTAREFVKTVIEETGCEVLDEYGTSWTERVRQEGVGILYPPTLT